MGARQSKRVEISGTSKKGDAENGGTIVGAEEKLEKIEEGETAVSKTNANGSTTTSSTVTAEQQVCHIAILVSQGWERNLIGFARVLRAREFGVAS